MVLTPADSGPCQVLGQAWPDQIVSEVPWCFQIKLDVKTSESGITKVVQACIWKAVGHRRKKPREVQKHASPMDVNNGVGIDRGKGRLGAGGKGEKIRTTVIA